MTCGVRAASDEDAAAMAALHSTAFHPDEAWPAASILGLLRLPGTFGLLVEDAGMLLFRRAADEAEILTLAVVPAMRGRGIARSLLHAAQDALRECGVRTVSLEVRSTNDAALGLYRSIGFRRVGQRPRYYFDGSDALILQTTL